MTTEAPTPLDRAAQAMAERPDAPAARLRFFERVLDAELHLLLEAEAGPEALRPVVYDLDAGRFAVAFDRADRLAGFLDAPTPYAAMAGRRLAAALAGRGLGLALNPGVAASETLLSAAEIDWLAGVAAAASAEPAGPARAREIGPPRGAEPALVAALAEKLAAMAGRIEAAWLAAVRLEDGAERLTLGIAGAPEAAQDAIAAAITEAARFSGVEGAAVDVAFLDPDAPAGAAFARAGLVLAVAPPPAAPSMRQGPGRDPDRPPKLR